MSIAMNHIGMASCMKVTTSAIKVSRAASRSLKAVRARRAVPVCAVSAQDLSTKYSKSALLDIAKQEPDFSLLNQAIENAGLTDALSTVYFPPLPSGIIAYIRSSMDIHIHRI
eukprot:1190536-Prorocentrum_minimum.AAC.3